MMDIFLQTTFYPSNQFSSTFAPFDGFFLSFINLISFCRSFTNCLNTPIFSSQFFSKSNPNSSPVLIRAQQSSRVFLGMSISLEACSKVIFSYSHFDRHRDTFCRVQRMVRSLTLRFFLVYFSFCFSVSLVVVASPALLPPSTTHTFLNATKISSFSTNSSPKTNLLVHGQTSAKQKQPFRLLKQNTWYWSFELRVSKKISCNGWVRSSSRETASQGMEIWYWWEKWSVYNDQSSRVLVILVCSGGNYSWQKKWLEGCINQWCD